MHVSGEYICYCIAQATVDHVHYSLLRCNAKGIIPRAVGFFSFLLFPLDG